MVTPARRSRSSPEAISALWREDPATGRSRPRDEPSWIARGRKARDFPALGRAGNVDPTSAVTDADGRARAVWTLGTDPGRQTLLASVENVDSALAIVAESDPIAANTKVTSLVENLSGPAGEQALRIRLPSASPIRPVGYCPTCPFGGRPSTAAP